MTSFRSIIAGTSIAAPWRMLADAGTRRLGCCRRLVPQVETFEPELHRLSDAELLERSLAVRHQVRAGTPPQRALPEVFALVREAARRTIGLRHFDVQLLGGMAMAAGCIAEMQTGEGKTLTATLPLVLHAYPGRGAHLATANDYLARRDAEWMGPVYRALGLTVGFVQSSSSPDERRAAYACDVTYGTAREFGFDFLRDRLLLRERGDSAESGPRLFGRDLRESPRRPVQRRFHFALVDEADHVLIDEARTPLVIASVKPAAGGRSEACYRWCAEVAPQFVAGQDYGGDHDRKVVFLTLAGRERVRSLPKPRNLDAVHTLELFEAVERAVLVRECFQRDGHYIVRDRAIVVVDETTGRPAEGRQWRGGIHQAIEAREALPLSPETTHAARITVQELFRNYRHLAGMTGTASSSSAEFRRVYRLPVVSVPTHCPSRRIELPQRVFRSADEKWHAVVEEIRAITAAGRPVLVGTRSVDESERLSRRLAGAGLPHDVLNAKRPEFEAMVVAGAGEPSRITVATNMAGRGTDIRLAGEVAAAGGLHVVCTELHDSARVDRQLIGRCGRQGDPGSFRAFLSLDDAVLPTAYGAELAARLKADFDGRSPHHIASLLRRAQARIERRHSLQRRDLMRHEIDRARMADELGQDPYLDLPET